MIELNIDANKVKFNLRPTFNVQNIWKYHSEAMNMLSIGIHQNINERIKVWFGDGYQQYWL